MGFDAFGLPAENYAIQTGTHPAVTTYTNINRFRTQIKSLGFSYDWSREVTTCDPEYYKWTQWIFLQLFKKGLAYEAEMPINWCPSCKTGLANEEVKDGHCDRCGTKVVRKRIRQWVLKITAYADRLLEDLDKLDWPEPIKLMQRNWIGKSEGATVIFKIDGHDATLEIYTTRPDTLFGATYMVLAPEHPLVPSITTPDRLAAVNAYIDEAAAKSDLERTDLAKDKTGVFTGAYAINPVNGARIPIWISDYVLISYGTGAIMAVPAHDSRDWDFAKKFNLPIIQVVAKPGETGPFDREPAECFEGEGIAVNSSEFNGLPTAEFKQRITAWLEERGIGKKAINYKLRDWLFSRQRYWGEPIPVVHCEHCGIVPLPEESLPLTLPEVKSYAPTGTGESPLATIEEWVQTTCPKCGGPARRETNTTAAMGRLLLVLPSISRSAQPESLRGPIQNRLLDARQPLCRRRRACGAPPLVQPLLAQSAVRPWPRQYRSSPFMRLVNQGMILGEDNQKMSKSRGNVINPDDIVANYGADTMRVYEMFMGPLEVSKPWSTAGLVGVSRFLERIWALSERAIIDALMSPELEKLLHKTIKKVTNDTATLNFNTAISQMMIYSNELAKLESIPRAAWEPFVLLIAPYAPHLGEELWAKLGHTESVSKAAWPTYNEALTHDEEKEIVVQINGKVRSKFTAPAGTAREQLVEMARQAEKISDWLAGKEIIKAIAVQDKLVNFVIKG